MIGSAARNHGSFSAVTSGGDAGCQTTCARAMKGTTTSSTTPPNCRARMRITSLHMPEHQHGCQLEDRSQETEVRSQESESGARAKWQRQELGARADGCGGEAGAARPSSKLPPPLLTLHASANTGTAPATSS